MPTNLDETTVFKAKGVKITSNTSHLTLVIKSIKDIKDNYFLEESGGGVY